MYLLTIVGDNSNSLATLEKLFSRHTAIKILIAFILSTMNPQLKLLTPNHC